MSIALLAAIPALAADSDDPIALVEPLGGRYRDAVTHLEAGNTEAALGEFRELVDTMASDAPVSVGPAFGNIFYHYGEALDASGRPREAIEAWRRCYTEYPNEPGAASRANHHVEAALLRWAETAFSLGQTGDAVKLYLQALKKHGDRVDRDQVLLNLARCMQATGDDRRAEMIFERILNQSIEAANADAFRIALLERCLAHARAGAFARLERLLHENRPALAVTAAQRLPLTPLLLQIARRCLFADHSLLALQFLHYAAHPDEADRMRRQRAVLGLSPLPAPPFDDQELMELQDAVLLARATALYQAGAYRVALAGYGRLFASRASDHDPQVLHAAATCASLIDEPDQAAGFIIALRNDHAEYPRLTEAMTSWLESLLRTDRFAEARDIGIEYRDALPAGRPERENIDFHVATALYRLEDFAASGAAFAAFRRDFPHSEQDAVAAYYEAASAVHERTWEDALCLLEALPALPDDLADGAVYYLAVASHMTGDIARAHDAVTRLRDTFPDSPHLGPALNIAGDQQFVLGDYESADTLYREAESAAATHDGQRTVRAYAAFQRIRAARYLKRWNQVLQRYDRFEQTYPLSAHLAPAAMEAAAALASQGHTDTALTLLVERILERADQPDDPDLPHLLDQHHTLYKTAHGYEALVERLTSFPGPRPTPRTLRAWLLMGRIEALESIGTSPASGAMQSLYQELTQTFETGELPDLFVLKLARWLHDTGEPRAAISYYRVLTDLRRDGDLKRVADLELARLLGAVGDTVEQDEALAMLDGILQAEPGTTMREAATLEVARIQMVRAEWAQAATAWQTLLDEPDWVSARAEAHYQLAACKDRLSQTDEALALYLGTYIHFEGHIEWSSRAFVRTALIYRDRGDEEKALAVLNDMMNRMGHLSHPVIDKARTLHRQWQTGKEMRRG